MAWHQDLTDKDNDRWKKIIRQVLVLVAVYNSKQVFLLKKWSFVIVSIAKSAQGLPLALWSISETVRLAFHRKNIDGQKLSQLMIDYEVGCTIQKTLSIKKIDEDYFES